MPEMSSALRDAFARHVDEPDHREPVIVTLVPGCSVGTIDGFEVRHTVRSGTIVMGMASADAARGLATHEGVVRIENDSGDMRALG